jgi:hypothetical protein
MLAFLCALTLAQGALAQCATTQELQAMTMRALQSELMVAALSCGMKDNYNHFIDTNKLQLRNHGTMLRGYFQRHHGGKAEPELNAFVTQLANQASRMSLNQSDRLYCRQASLMFRMIQAQQATQLGSIFYARYQPWHETPNCEPTELATN